MAFAMSARSLSRLEQAHPALRRVVPLALSYSPWDFYVDQVLRDLDTQRWYFETGRSLTMESKHLPQADGFSHAVDLVATGDLNKDGVRDAQDLALIWNREKYEAIASAMLRAGHELGVGIRWGGTFKRRDGSDFFDGPHFELVL